MGRVNKEAKALNRLASELNIVDSEDVSLSADAEYQKSYHRIDWTSQESGESTDIPDMTVELIIDYHGDNTRLLHFIKKMDLSFQEGSENYDGILRTSFLWNGCVSITTTLEPEKLSELMIRLAALPEVDKVEDELFARGISQGTERKFRDLPYPVVSKVNNRIRVTLNETFKAK